MDDPMMSPVFFFFSPRYLFFFNFHKQVPKFQGQNLQICQRPMLEVKFTTYRKFCPGHFCLSRAL